MDIWIYVYMDMRIYKYEHKDIYGYMISMDDLTTTWRMVFWISYVRNLFICIYLILSLEFSQYKIKLALGTFSECFLFGCETSGLLGRSLVPHSVPAKAG